HRKVLSGKPVQLLAGRRDGFRVRGNSLFARDGDPAYLITLGMRSPLEPPQTVAQLQAKYPHLFGNNTTADPCFVNAAKRVLDLRLGSPLIDRGEFLTRTVGSGSGTSLPVSDASYFYDGYGIAGEVGDVIQLASQTRTARVRKIDYEKNVLLLDQALTWESGQGVALRYVGEAPDIGAREFLPGGNAPPVAAFRALPRAEAPLTVRFDATASADPDGKCASYEWRFGDGQALRSTKPVTDHAYAAPGTYRAVLTVVDDADAGLSSGAALDVHVGHPRLAVSRRTLDFGPTGAVASVELSNTGTGMLAWRLVGAPQWLSPHPPSGSFARAQRIDFRVSRSALKRGSHSGRIRVEAGAAGSADIDVRMSVPTLRRVELIRVGDVWRYLKGTAAPPARWNQADFDDSKWSSGPSGIGFGDLEYGVRLDDMPGNYLTFYARRTFQVADPARVPELTLSLQYDDGVIAYLNGREVARSASMGTAGTPAAFNARAIAKHDEEAPAESYVIRLAPGAISAGRNVLAIEVHNEWIKGSDAGVVPRLTASVVMDERVAARNRSLWTAGLGAGGLAMAVLAGWGLRRARARSRRGPAARWVRGRGRALVDWSLVAAVSAAIIVFSHCPPEVVDAGHHDKKLHFAAYGLLTLLVLRAIGRNGALVRALTAVVAAVDRRVGLVQVCAAPALVGLLGAATELTQPLSGRQRSVRDLAANLIGACLAVLAWLIGRALLGRRGKG
ncbi:MAG: PKD domain-containing protein, partial [Planctomycetota bacterium]